MFIITLDDESEDAWIACGPTHASFAAARATSSYDGQHNELSKSVWTKQRQEEKSGGIYNTAAGKQEHPAFILELTR